MKTKILIAVTIVLLIILSLSCKKISVPLSLEEDSKTETKYISGEFTFTISNGQITMSPVNVNHYGNQVNGYTILISTTDYKGPDGNFSGYFSGYIEYSGNYENLIIKINHASAQNNTPGTDGSNETINAIFTITTTPQISTNCTISVTGTPSGAIAVSGTGTLSVTSGNFTGLLSETSKLSVNGSIDAIKLTLAITGSVGAITKVFTSSPNITGTYAGTQGAISKNINVNISYDGGPSTSVNVTLSSDGSLTNISGTGNTTVTSNGSFSVIINGVSVSGNLSAVAAVGANVSVTLNGYIDTNGNFYGDASINYQSTSTSSTNINVTITSGTTNTIKNVTATGDGSQIAVSGSTTVSVTPGGTFTAVINGVTFTGTLPSTAVDANVVTLTVNGIVTNNVFSGTISGSFPSTASFSASVTVTATYNSVNTNITSTFTGDGSIAGTSTPDNGGVSETSTNTSVWNYGIYPGSLGSLPSEISNAIDNAISSGQNAVIYWKSYFKHQPKYYLGYIYHFPTYLVSLETRTDYRCIKIVHNSDGNTVTVSFGWYDKNGTKKVIPLKTCGASPIFKAGVNENYVKPDYSKTNTTVLKWHARQFFWMNGIIWE